MKILLITPPMMQLNTPYPATSYLAGFLRKQGINAVQRDAAIDLLYSLFSSTGLNEIRLEIEERYAEFDDDQLPDSVYHFLAEFPTIERTITPVLRFLQGKDPTLALQIASGNLLPEGKRFNVLNDSEYNGELEWAFGKLGIQDQAKYLATLYFEDLVDAIREGIDSHFELAKYGEQLATRASTFDVFDQCLKAKPTLIEKHLQHLVEAYQKEENSDVIGLSVPFPGNLLGALQIAKHYKAITNGNPVILGGGYINTELRSLNETRLFNYVDYLTLDDGERPLVELIQRLQTKDKRPLKRTFYLREQSIHYDDSSTTSDFHFSEIGTPTYEGLKLDRYLSLFDMLNPMHRIWSDGRWNKLTLAHGCYWSKCAFCDLSLDYIKRYEMADIEIILDRIEALMEETGQSGFHFVDEAAPPKLLYALAEGLVRRNLLISWWANIRFEKNFNTERVKLLAKSGCIAVSGGLEVASDRLLKLMNKGVTVQQVADVTATFAQAGIYVHAYLMYGFPTQTEEETLLSLEYVRQLMEVGCIQSGYWHRFAATIHSPVGMQPENYGIKLNPLNSAFAKNEIDFSDPTHTDHQALSQGLNKALYNYMRGIGFDIPVHQWFDKTIKPLNMNKIKMLSFP